MWRYLIPNAFSGLNLVFGLVSIYCSLCGEVTFAALAIVAGMVCDALDGATARLLQAGSAFGKEMDALCDLVAFGVAPAFLLLIQLWDLNLSPWQLLPMAAFPLCGALRLARFNTTTVSTGTGFIGMPITAAGGILAVCAEYWPRFGVMGSLCIAILLSFLMVSRFPYPDIKALSTRLLASKVGLLCIILLITLALVFWGEWLLVPLLGYAAAGILLVVFKEKQR